MARCQEEYSNYNSHLVKRIFSEKRVIERFGSVPQTMHRLILPRLIERLVGKLYEVNESQRALLRGEDERALVIEALIEGKRAAVRNAYRSSNYSGKKF